VAMDLSRAVIPLWATFATIVVAVVVTATATHLFDARAHYGKHAECTPVSVAELQDDAAWPPQEKQPSRFQPTVVDAGDAPTAPLLLPVAEKPRCLPFPVPVSIVYTAPADRYGRHALRQNRSSR
jgi:hypothetical protein